MITQINDFFSNHDFDVRKSKDARFSDQKITPDVLCVIADCVLNYDVDRGAAFTANDIWDNQYFNVNVKKIFQKPDTQNETTKREYDKFISQPLRALSYANVLTMEKSGNKNIYRVNNKSILEFIAMKERNAYVFLYQYFVKVLSDSGQLMYFENFKNKCIEGTVSNGDLSELKSRFQCFILGNTSIKKELEINRIFPKILNIYACENNIQGIVKGRLSKSQFYYSDLMYNRTNWRDINKDKNVSRGEALEEEKSTFPIHNEAYSDYMVQKAMNMIRKLYKESEVRDQWANGEATQVHHIFSKSDAPKLAHFLENIIKLTPTQHFTKAHPSNKTDAINRDYQLVCLLAKSDSIEKSLARGEFFYSKESFIYIINQGLDLTLDYSISLAVIKQKITLYYNTN